MQDVLLKRMRRQEKKAVKRLNDDGDKKVVFEKDEYLAKIAQGDYDMALHFKQEGNIEIDPANKLTSMVFLPSHKKRIQFYLASP